MAAMELLTATAREVTETAADNRAFSQENFMLSSSLSLPHIGEDRIYLVTVVRRRKKCGKAVFSLKSQGQFFPRGLGRKCLACEQRKNRKK